MLIDNIINIFRNNLEMHGGGKKKIDDFKKTELKIYNMQNGMKTLCIPLSDANTISVGIFINAGSRNEKEAFGIAHFLEHMTFKGTNKRSSDALMNELDSLGAIYNAMTAHEFTLYYISGDPRDSDKLIDIVIDLYKNPTYPNEDIDKERNVVLEEQRMNEDNYHRCLSNKLYEEMFKNSMVDLSRPIIGYKNTIKKFTRNDIIKYRNKNYQPSNCVLCISGKFDINDMLSNIEKYLDTKLTEMNITSNLYHENIINTLEIDPLDKSIQRHIHINKDINQTIINFVFNSYNTYNKHEEITDLLSDILSNGFSSRLYNLLRNKLGVSYYNNSILRSFNDVGQYIISVGVEHKSVLKTITAILNELKNIVKYGITKEELNKAKKQNETSLLFQFKDPYEYLMYYGMHVLIGKPLYNLSDMLSNIENITLDDIKNTTRETFKSGNIIIGTIGQVSESDSRKIIELINKF